MKQWVKLWTEILHDRKMHILSDQQFRLCINLFAMAGIVDDEGALMSLHDMAFQLRIGSSELQTNLEALRSANITDYQDGQWHLVHYVKRQPTMPSAEREAVAARVRKHRAKAKLTDVTTLPKRVTKCNDMGNGCNDNRVEESRVEESRVEESRVEIYAAAAATLTDDPRNAQFFELLSRAGMVLSSLMVEQYQDILSETTEFGLIEEAFVEAANTDSRPTPKWLRTVLDRCQRDRCRPGQWKQKSGRGNTREPPDLSYEHRIAVPLDVEEPDATPS